MKPITRVKGSPHITPLMDAMWHEGIIGTETCALNAYENFMAQIITNNEIRIRSGVGMIQGRFFCIEPNTYDAITISNGTQGEKRIDLIVARWTVDDEQKTQDGDWAVIQGTSTTGTPSAPAYTEGDLDNGDLIVEAPYYEVELDGINIVEVRKVFNAAPTLTDIDNLISAETIQAFADAGLPISGGGV